MSTGKVWLWAGGGLAALGLGVYGWTHRHYFFVHDVTSGESAAYPKLRSRVYYSEPGRVLSAAEKAIERLPGWTLVANDSENDALEAQTRTGLLTDDVTVYVQPLDRGQCRVTIRSRSRAGAGDLGRNASHVRQLQEAMDGRLNGDAAF